LLLKGGKLIDKRADLCSALSNCLSLLSRDSKVRDAVERETLQFQKLMNFALEFFHSEWFGWMPISIV
jgi:hypothetical protein